MSEHKANEAEAATEDARLQTFMEGFVRLVADSRLAACTLIFVNSKTEKGKFSVRLGGDAQACKLLEALLAHRTESKPEIYTGENHG